MRSFTRGWCGAVLVAAVAMGCGGKTGHESSGSASSGRVSAAGASAGVDANTSGVAGAGAGAGAGESAGAGAGAGESAGAGAGAGATGASGSTSGASGASGATGSSGATSGIRADAGSGSTSGSSGSTATSGFDASAQQTNKIDLLFDIDNSASMGDKQDYLAQAIPDLVDRLVNPNCVSAADGVTVTGKSVAGTNCATGSQPEFPAIKDMHIGIVTSSLGPRLSEMDPTLVTGVCNSPQNAQAPYANLNAHMDDMGHLIGRSLTYGPPAAEGTVADTTAAGFLYWYPTTAGLGIDGLPSGTATPLTAAATLENDVTALASGAGVFGCGIESQLESWYRFLVQPDPYATLSLDSTHMVSGQPSAQWVGVDATIIQERHDFLRPDSIVAVVVLSDENDSEIDVRSLGGLGYFFMHTGFMPPHGTSVCATNPLDPGCVSCAPGNLDPRCVAAGGGVAVYSAINDWGYDPNLRHVHMRQKYGIDPQFPVERYLYGLTSPTIGDRSAEYPAGATSYSALPATFDCVNPLFAASLPTSDQLSTSIATTVSAADASRLCHLAPGTRSPEKVFFAHIGGVPHQLLHFTPGNPGASTLTSADWVKILGTDPEKYDYTGIDPHMYESYTPRLPGQAESLTSPPTFDTSGTNALAPTSAPSTTDPVSGREWITDVPLSGHRLEVDRQFACIFPLATPRDCTNAVNGYSCDCPSTPLTHDQTPPVCSDTTPTSQIAAKAYPTVRELLLAKLMGAQGIVSSICPVHVADSADHSDPLYGYRPVVSQLVDRIKPFLL